MQVLASMADLRREILFAWRETSVRWMLFTAFAFGLVSLLLGGLEIRDQKQQIESLLAQDQADRAYVLDGRTDPGDIAYSVFHLTYDPPSDLAFTALGVRDELPWKHRLRALALEGQIYETDAGNVELSLLGKLDFAYFVAFLLPLFVIGLLYDVNARERREARYELVCAASPLGERVLLIRAIARALLLVGAIGLPLLLLLLISGIPLGAAIALLGIVIAHTAFWLVLSRFVTQRNIEGITAAISLVSVWILLAVVVPVLGKVGVERIYAVPNGGDILLTQRETVNDAWDLPKSATFEPFLEVHPEWSDYVDMDRPFEWKWYYAFQQVGDQVAEPLSSSLYSGMADRRDAVGWLSVLSPPLLVEQTMMKLADTDVSRHLHYIGCARAFHKRIRHFHYPMLFEQEPFSEAKMADLPEFEPCE